MNTADSTQLDEHQAAPDAPAVSDQPAFVSPREAAMAAIDDQVTRQLQEQGVFSGDEATPADPNLVPATADPAERLLKVKIGGEELELPESEVVKGYQKDKYADQRLREAADRLKDVEERERQLALQTASPPEPATPAPPTADAVELAQQIVDGIAEGDFGNAVQVLAQALSSARQGTSTPNVDEAMVTQLVEKANTTREYELDKQKANKIFDEQFGDIADDEDKFAIAQGYYARAVAAGKMPSEAALAAGTKMRELFAPAATPPPDPLKGRQERKEGIDTITPATGVTAAGASPEAQSDPRSVIEEMKRQRGQT